MLEPERISIRDLELSDEIIEMFRERQKQAAKALTELDPNAREYNPRFPLADQSLAARKDFYYKLECMRAEQEYFDLLQKKQNRGTI